MMVSKLQPGPELIFNPPVIAHRGASAQAPENTVAAFIKALQLGIQWVEFDIMLTQDEIVLLHDFTLERTTNGKGWVGEHSYQYLQTLDAGMWFSPTFSGEKIPLLSDILLFLRDSKLSANIEIKVLEGDEDRFMQKLVELVKHYLNDPKFSLLFSSFSIPVLYRLREYLPTANIGFLMDEWDSDWKKYCDELQCVSVHTNYEIMTEQRAQQIKNSRRSILCYTVNDVELAKNLFAMGVTAVFSNVPEVIAEGVARV